MLGINETKLGEDFHDHLVSIDGFKIVKQDCDKLGGGVALYIGDSVNFKVINLFTRKFTKIVIYRNPTKGSMAFLCGQLLAAPVF